MPLPVEIARLPLCQAWARANPTLFNANSHVTDSSEAWRRWQLLSAFSYAQEDGQALSQARAISTECHGTAVLP
jgi:hypothetical protein